MVKRDPSWVIWVIQSMWPTGFAYGAGFISDQMPPGFPLLVHEPLGSAGAYLSVPAERGIHRAGRYFRRCVFVGVGVGRVLLSDGASSSSVLPRAKPGLGGPGSIAEVAWDRPGLGLLRERVESLIWPSPGRGEMTVGGVSIAPARRFVPGHAQPVQQLPHRGTRGTAALHIECSFPWGCGAAARNRSIPRTADGQYQLAGPHPAVSGADGSSAAQPLIPATGPPECLCGTSGSARPDRPR